MSPTTRNPPSHRRARRSGRLVAIIIAAVVVIAGGTAAAIAVSVNNGKSDTPKTATSEAGGNATTPAPTPTTTTVPPSTSPSPSPTPSPSGDSGAAAALQKCRVTIGAADATVAAARTGAAHWTVHTQARTDFLAHKITLAQTNAEFKRTKLAGPSDQRTFADALAAYEQVANGCNGLSTSSQPAAATCATKAAALHTTVVAGQAVMKDWASHLNNMALHADHEMSATQARNEWIAAWKDAPPHLNAFSAADSASTKTPSCPAG